MPVKTNYSKNGSNYFRVTATVGKTPDGKPIRKEFYGKSKKEAESKRDKYLCGLKQGLQIDFKETTLKELMHIWLFEVLHVSGTIKPSTFDRYEGIYRNYLRDSELGRSVIAEIKVLHIQRYYNKLYENGKPPSTIKNIHKVLRYFFNYALSQDFVIKNPCFKIAIPGNASEKQSKDIDPFTNDEIDKIRKDIKNRNIDMAINLSFGTGLRIGELLALTEKDINFEKGELTVDKNLKRIKDIKKDGSHEYKYIIQTPKTKNSARTIPIPSTLIFSLKQHVAKQKLKHLKEGIPWDSGNLIFTTEGCNYIDDKNILRAWQRCLNRAGVRYRSLHTIRHTYATKLFENGIPLKTVQMLLGHSDIKITADIYTHVMPKEKEKAADTLNSLFL